MKEVEVVKLSLINHIMRRNRFHFRQDSSESVPYTAQ